jgi:hypothetical protein
MQPSLVILPFAFCNHVIPLLNDGSFSLLLKQFRSCFLQDRILQGLEMNLKLCCNGRIVAKLNCHIYLPVKDLVTARLVRPLFILLDRLSTSKLCYVE